MIKNIIFDLGNVILKDSPSIVLDNFKETVENYQFIKNVFFDNWTELDLGYETIEEHLYNCKLDSSIDEKVKQILLNYYKYRPFNDEIIDLIKKLKKNGYNIYILSNNNKETYDYLKKLPMLKLVDGWVISCEYHFLKPNKKLYSILFDTFNIYPEESFFIDDKKENIIMSENLGMKGFVLDIKNQGLDKLIETLRKYNVKF